MAYYTTRVKLKNRAKGLKGSKAWTKSSYKSRNRKKTKRLGLKRLKKVALVIFGIFVIASLIGLIVAFGWIQSITEDLPSPDKPFGRKAAASEIYDRNGKLLYRLFGDENRDPVKLKEVPPLLRWAYLAAEDIDFYSHPGVDMSAVIRCAIMNLSKESACGGSTITQQLIKQTALSRERKLERKIKEVILAMQIEKVRTKEEIFEMYLNVAPEGSNIYGVKSGAREYFGKELADLNLAEMAILAAIPNNPNNLSPTRSSNPDSKTKVKERQMYVLDQMEKYMDKINEAIKAEAKANTVTEVEGEAEAGTETEPIILTKEMITEAREFELVYASMQRNEELKAPHFVFYVSKLLQQRGYDAGEPFTMDSLETKGYKIYTTLDLDFQAIAEEQVRKGADVYGKKFGGDNASLVAMSPKTGEVLAMVGSKDYWGTSHPEGCSGPNCRFAPHVNVADTLQSYGSSLKPMVYYYAFQQGLVSPGSVIPDMPIQINNYKPKNYGFVFIGIRSVRKMLNDSQNIPAIYLVDQLGVDNFRKEMEKWGYTTFNDPRGYGPAIAVGGADVTLIEHAQAFGVLANNGYLTKHEVVLKIIDIDGNIVYEYEPKSEKVADERAVYLINHILNGKNGGPGFPDSRSCKWDGRDAAGKTGTSEEGKDTMFAHYTPEISVVGWLGNNNNDPMSTRVSGFQSAKPWISEFTCRVAPSLPNTSFPRPAGIANDSGCESDIDGACSGFGSDISIAGMKVPSYVSVKTYTVCADQRDHLARKIDIDMGMATKVTIKSYRMPNTKLQSQYDAWLAARPDQTGGRVPTEYCTINRNPSGNEKPWAVIEQPGIGPFTPDQSLTLSFNAYSPNSVVQKVEVYIDGALKTTVTSLPYSTSIGKFSAGSHTVKLKVFDNVTTGETSRTFSVINIGSITLNNPGDLTLGQPVTLTFSYNGGGSLTDVILLANGSNAGPCSTTSCSFTPGAEGGLTLQIQASVIGSTIKSNIVSVTVKPPPSTE